MNPIIQDFLDQGHITKEASERLEDFEGMLKQADWMNFIKDMGMNLIKGVVPVAIGSAAGQAAYNYFGQSKLEEEDDETRAGLLNSFNTMMVQNPHLEAKRPLVTKRFNEIASLSPTVAGASSVASKLIRRVLTKGLDENDMKNLITLEVNAKSLKYRPKPKTIMGDISKTIFEGVGQSVGTQLSGNFQNPGSNSGGVSAGGGLGPDIIPGAFVKKGKDIGRIYNALSKRNFAFPSGLQNLDMRKRDDFHVLVHYINDQPSSPLNQWASQAGFKSPEEFQSAIDQELTSSIDQEGVKTAQLLACQYSLFKSAGIAGKLTDFWKNHGSVVKGLGIVGAFGTGAAVSEQVADYTRTRKQNSKIKDSWDKTQKNLKTLSESGDRLSSEINYKDKNTAAKALDTFKVLIDIAPSLAANPTVATSFVNTVMLNEGQMTPDFIKMLSETQKNITLTNEYKSPFAGSPIASGFSSGFSAAGGPSLIKGVAESVVGK